jgi:hypothetical protein
MNQTLCFFVTSSRGQHVDLPFTSGGKNTEVPICGPNLQPRNTFRVQKIKKKEKRERRGVDKQGKGE